jgi:hypothetical protein
MEQLCKYTVSITTWEQAVMEETSSVLCWGYITRTSIWLSKLTVTAKRSQKLVAVACDSLGNQKNGTSTAASHYQATTVKTE